MYSLCAYEGCDADLTTETSVSDDVVTTVDKRFTASRRLLVRVAAVTFEDDRIHSAMSNCTDTYM